MAQREQRTISKPFRPMMGGKSTGSFKVENGIGIFDGNVAIVPKLKAPDFLRRGEMMEAMLMRRCLRGNRAHG